MRKAFYVIGLFVMLAGCGGAIKIKQIADNPGKYINREVHVNGVVKRSYSIPIAGYYQLDDGTGTLHVLANGSAPRTGSEVSVKGVVTGGVNVMGHNLATTLREREHHAR